MIRKFSMLLVAGLLAAGSAQADSLSFSFNDSSAQLGYSYLLNQNYNGTSQINGRGLYNDDENTKLLTGGFEFSGQPGNVPGLRIGVGTELNLGKTDPSEELFAVGVLGTVGYAPPILNGVGFNLRLAYAPNILSFMDLERMFETNLNVTYAITPTIKLLLEYQNIQADLEDRGTETIDEGIRLGFAATF